MGERDQNSSSRIKIDPPAIKTDWIHSDTSAAGRICQYYGIELPEVAVRTFDETTVSRAGDNAGGFA